MINVYYRFKRQKSRRIYPQIIGFQLAGSLNQTVRLTATQNQAEKQVEEESFVKDTSKRIQKKTQEGQGE